MLIKSQRDFWTGLLLAVVGVTSAVSAGQRWLAAGAGTGTVALAAGLAAALTLLGVALWFTSLTIETEGGEPIRGRGGAAALAIVGAAVAYATCVRPLGSLAAGVVAAVLGTLAVPAGRGRSAAALAAGAIAFLALVAWGSHGALLPWPRSAR